MILKLMQNGSCVGITRHDRIASLPKNRKIEKVIWFYVFCAFLGVIVGTILYEISPLERYSLLGGGGIIRASEVQRIREEIEALKK